MSTYKELDSPNCLVFGLSEPGSVPEEEFNDWYNNEHIPLVLDVPGILSCTRFKALDSLKPSWLALLDIASPAVIQSSEFQSLPSKASEREKQIMANLATLDLRVYEPLDSRINSEAKFASLPIRYVFVAHARVGIDADEDFNKWYNEEYMVLLAKIPEWLCGKRYKLLGSVLPAIELEPSEKEKPYIDYLAIHELESQGFMGLPEFIDTIKAPWREQVMKSVTFSESRLFEQYKVFRPLHTSEE